MDEKVEQLPLVRIQLYAHPHYSASTIEILSYTNWYLVPHFSSVLTGSVLTGSVLTGWRNVKHASLPCVVESVYATPVVSPTIVNPSSANTRWGLSLLSKEKVEPSSYLKENKI